MNIGKAIRIYRKKKQIPQKNLYQGFCSRRQISRIENNESLPSLEMIIHISNILNVGLDELIEIAKKVDN